MRGQSRTTINGQVAAAGTSFVLNVPVGRTLPLTKSDGVTVPVSGDALAIRLSNGTWLLTTVSTYTATTNGSQTTYTIVVNTAVPTGTVALNGAKIIYYGVAADTYHASYTFPLTASATTQIPVLAGQDLTIVRAPMQGEPLLFDSNNATAAGTLNEINVAYSRT